MRCCLVSSPMAVNIFAEAEKFSAKVKIFSFGSMHISLSFKRLNCKQYSIEYWKTFIGKENRDERKAFGKFYYVNPGSVSIPKNGSNHSYMIYENGKFTLKNLCD